MEKLAFRRIAERPYDEHGIPLWIHALDRPREP
jgi:hypothetical protein